MNNIVIVHEHVGMHVQLGIVVVAGVVFIEPVYSESPADTEVNCCRVGDLEFAAQPGRLFQHNSHSKSAALRFYADRSEQPYGFKDQLKT